MHPLRVWQASIMSVTITAVTVLSQNGYTVYSAGPPITGDFTAVDTEYCIDDAINQVNLLTEKNIPSLSGTAGSKSVTLSRLESAPVKLLITIMLREAKKTSLSNSSSTSGSNSTSQSWNFGPMGASQGSSVGTAISATSAMNNAANSPLMDLFNRSIEKLKSSDQTWSYALI
jgi:hypothetical protein